MVRWSRMAKVDDGVGKATGRDICVITGRNCKRYTRNAMVQGFKFKLMASRQENPNRDAPRRPGKRWWLRIVSRSERTDGVKTLRSWRTRILEYLPVGYWLAAVNGVETLANTQSSTRGYRSAGWGGCSVDSYVACRRVWLIGVIVYTVTCWVNSFQWPKKKKSLLLPQKNSLQRLSPGRRELYIQSLNLPLLQAIWR